MSSIEALKKIAAEKAVEQVKSGMVLGLGTGSTTRYAVDKIGQLYQSGQLTDIVGIPTSEATAERARSYGVPLTTLDQHPVLDVAIDGADEVDPQLNVIKGLGGALLREKMVEMNAKRLIIVVDDRKVSTQLGLVSPLPVEVIPFNWKFTARWLAGLGCTPVLRGGEDSPYITDNHNYILDCHFAHGIDDPAALAATLRNRVGVVEHGLFLGMVHQVIVAAAAGVSVME
ncbi:MAG: ribose 5-phosphate isomerase A [Chloroflexi bacterium]|nr:MAG: ribose 5-phosphate isomerase A [Chloroflexota bacterium]